jgi:hypothetical protein
VIGTLEDGRGRDALLRFTRFTRALLLVLLLYSEESDKIAPIYYLWKLLDYSRCTHALLMLYSCFTHALLMLYSCCTHALLMLYSCFTHALLMLYSCFTHALLINRTSLRLENWRTEESGRFTALLGRKATQIEPIY